MNLESSLQNYFPFPLRRLRKNENLSVEEDGKSNLEVLLSRFFFA